MRRVTAGNQFPACATNPAQAGWRKGRRATSRLRAGMDWLARGVNPRRSPRVPDGIRKVSSSARTEGQPWRAVCRLRRALDQFLGQTRRRAVGISRSTLSDLERGEISGRSLEILAGLARSHRVSADSLLALKPAQVACRSVAGLTPGESELVELVRQLSVERSQARLLVLAGEPARREDRRMNPPAPRAGCCAHNPLSAW